MNEDRHVLAFDVAGFVEAFAKRGRIARVGLGRPVSDKPNYRHHRLLRARGERPRRSRPANKRDELAPPHELRPQVKGHTLAHRELRTVHRNATKLAAQ